MAEAYALAGGSALEAQTRAGPTAPVDAFVLVWDPDADAYDDQGNVVGKGSSRRMANAEGPGESWRTMNSKVRVKPSRAAAVLACGADPYVDDDGDIVCYVDEKGEPTCPVERVTHCGSRWCWSCARRWAQRSMAVVADRLRALDDPMSRQALVDALVDEAAALRRAVEHDREELRQLAELAEPEPRPPADILAVIVEARVKETREWRRTSSMLATATRKERRAKTIQRYASAEPRLLTLTQAPTVLPDDCTGPELQAALERDADRLNARIRKLTLGDEWRGRATAWAVKIEQTLSTPARRQEMANRGARSDEGRERGTWWHVHAHCVVWGIYWPQAQLLDEWRSTAEAPGVEAPDGGARIEVPKRWPKPQSMSVVEMAKARADALREALKYATKPLDILYHHPSAAAAMILAMQGRRLLRLGGALEGLKLPEEEEPTEVVDPVKPPDGPGPLFEQYENQERIDPETGEVIDEPVLIEARRGVWRTLSGRWIDPFDDEAAHPSTTPEAREKARAWREKQWRLWKERAP